MPRPFALARAARPFALARAARPFALAPTPASPPLSLTQHAGKKKKMQNGAIVTMTVDCFTMEDGEEVYMIQPDSIQEVHRGFKK